MNEETLLSLRRGVAAIDNPSMVVSFLIWSFLIRRATRRLSVALGRVL
jgi:hypothetical protein